MEEVRARLTARGFEEEDYVSGRSPTVSKRTFKLFLAITSSKNYEIRTTDIKSAFLQTNQMKRDVYIQPPKEARVEEAYIWKLKTALYGLNDAALQFYLTVRELLLSLNMKQSRIDPCLFYYHKEGKLHGSICIHVDDFLHGGDKEFDEEIMKKVMARFQVGKMEARKFKYVGFEVDQNNQEIQINQNKYVEEIELPKLTAERKRETEEPLTGKENTELRALIGALNWASRGTRPDIAFEVVDTSMKLRTPTVSDLSRAIKAAIKAKAEASFITFPNRGTH